MNLSNKKKLNIAMALILILGCYLGGVAYFRTHFLPRTYLQDVSLSQDTVSQAQDRLDQGLQKAGVSFQEGDQDLGYLPLEELGPDLDLTQELETALSQQSAWAWPFHLFYTSDLEGVSLESLSFEESALTALIDALVPDNEERTGTQDARLIQGDDGTYEVQEEVYGQQVSVDSLAQALRQEALTQAPRVDLAQAYVQPNLVLGDEGLEAIYDELQAIGQTPITLTLEDQDHVIPQEEIQSWVGLDESGHPSIDLEAVENYLQTLNEEYAGQFHPHLLNSTYQGEVWVPAGTYGWYIDRFEEAPILADKLLAQEAVHHEPVIGGAGYNQVDPIGPDYVEVDLAHQMMSIYRDQVMVFQTPIVSGITGAETIPGSYQVWNMESPSNLVGYDHINERDYVQPVTYWIAFDNQEQGIHDADWQSSFGGSTYLTAGSLGCINVSPSEMGQVYDLIYVGMPVLVF